MKDRILALQPQFLDPHSDQEKLFWELMRALPSVLDEGSFYLRCRREIAERLVGPHNKEKFRDMSHEDPLTIHFQLEEPETKIACRFLPFSFSV